MELDQSDQSIDPIHLSVLEAAEAEVLPPEQRLLGLYANYYCSLLRELDDRFIRNEITDEQIELDWKHIEAGQLWASGYCDKSIQALILCVDYPNNGTHILANRLNAAQHIQWLKDGIEGSTQLHLPEMQASLLNALGIAYRQLGQHEEAIRAYYRCIAIAEKINDPGLGHYMNNYGVVVLKMGRYKEAKEFYEAALQLFEQRQDPLAVQQMMANLGVVYRNLGELGKASDLYQQALQTYRAQGDQRGESGALENLGILAALRNDYRNAEALLNSALAISKKLEDFDGCSNTNTSLANLYASTERYEEAISCLDNALTIDRQRNDKRGEIIAMLGLGKLYAQILDKQKSLEAYQAAYHLSQSANYVEHQAQALLNLGAQLMEDASTKDQAKAIFLEARTLAEQYHYLPVLAAVLTNLASLYEESKNNSTIQYYEQSYDIFYQLEDYYNQALVLCNIGMWHEKNNLGNEAELSYQKAQRIFTELQNLEWLEWVAKRLQAIHKSA